MAVIVCDLRGKRKAESRKGAQRCAIAAQKRELVRDFFSCRD
jgi:hypothetical protein